MQSWRAPSKSSNSMTTDELRQSVSHLRNYLPAYKQRMQNSNFAGPFNLAYRMALIRDFLTDAEMAAMSVDIEGDWMGIEGKKESENVRHTSED